MAERAVSSFIRKLSKINACKQNSILEVQFLYQEEVKFN